MEGPEGHVKGYDFSFGENHFTEFGDIKSRLKTQGLNMNSEFCFPKLVIFFKLLIDFFYRFSDRTPGHCLLTYPHSHMRYLSTLSSSYHSQLLL